MVCRVLDEVGRTLWGGVHFTTMFPFIMSSYSVHAPDQYSQFWKLQRASENCKVVYFVDSQSGAGKFSIEWLNESNYTRYSEYTTDTSEDALKNALRGIISKTSYVR